MQDQLPLASELSELKEENEALKQSVRLFCKGRTDIKRNGDFRSLLRMLDTREGTLEFYNKLKVKQMRLVHLNSPRSA